MKHEKSAESLHNVGNGNSKKVMDAFVNPGTPEKAPVSMSDRKTGTISANATKAIRNAQGMGGHDKK